MANNDNPFQRSTQTLRSPPQKQTNGNSLLVDPNASSCPLCTSKDTVEMVECEKCKNWYHFQCVGVDASIASVNWNCQKCQLCDSNCPLCNQEDSALMLECITCKTLFHFRCVGADTTVDATVWKCMNCLTKPTNVGNRSVRSSTSSKRRSILQLEKLAKEKAIKDKLIKEKSKLAEQQAQVDTEFLQKEYDIRDNMTESEDEDLIGSKTTNRTDQVTDWLQSTDTINRDMGLGILGRPPSIKEMMRNMKATYQQITQEAIDNILSRDVPLSIDLSLIPPKHVQFAQPLINESLDKSTDNVNPVDDQTFLKLKHPARPSIYEPESMNLYVNQNRSHSETKLEPVNNTFAQPTEMDVIDITTTDPMSDHLQSHTNQNTLAYSGQTDLIITSPFMNHTNQPPLIPITTTIAPNPAQPSTSPYMNHMEQPPLIPITATVVPNQGQPLMFSMIPPQQFITSSVQQSTPYPNLQQSTASTGTAPTGQPVASAYQQQSVPISVYQQPIMSSTANSQHSIPISTYQQPIMTNQQQFVTSSAQQQMYGPSVMYQPALIPNQNLGLINMSGFGQPSQAMMNQLNYDPQLNPQQSPPTRLQLAARQTMPRDYPKFNGDPERWSIFVNAYTNCTTTCGLSNGENLSRLERCLEGPARKAIQNLLTRPEAVPDIIETLKMLYGRPEASIDAQLRVIRHESPPQMNKMETFIDFAMSVRNVTSEIQKTGMWQYLWNPQLMQELVDKLPYQMRMEWGQIKMSTPNVNLSNFSEWLFLRARTACAVTLPSKADKKSNPNDKSNSGGHVNTHTKSTNSSKNNSHSNEDSNTKSCNACNGKRHDIYECRKFLGMSLNDKWETVKSNKLCRICLGHHHVLRCESKSLCGESGCLVKHHRLLHNPTKTVQTVTTIANSVSNHSAHQQNSIVILRRYIPVTLYGPNGSLNVIAFLDEGSDMTLVEIQVAQKLGITGILTDLFLEWTAKIVRKEPNSKSITLKISGTQTYHKQYEIKDARTVKSLDLPPQTIDIDQLRNKFQFLRRIPIESYTDETPKILIGLRDCKLSTPLKTRSGQWHEPIAAKTLLGSEVHGTNAPSAQVSRVNFHINNEINDDDKLHEMVAQFFSLENFGVKKPEQTVEAASDKRAKRLLESTTIRIGSKFETGLLWKYDNVSLPDSLPMAKRRLVSLEKRLQKDPDLASKFRSKFYEYVEKGYVRKLTEEEEAETNEKTWYLPLFPVTYPKKPGKIRLVWDAAAKVSHISLNSMLLSGPDLLVSLQGVLYRFRQGAYVVTGDIREMFHQVLIRKEDQSSQRFLWRELGSAIIEKYVLQVMSFGATCSPSSAQYVKNQNALEFVEKYPRAEKAIRTNTYVDDWLQAFDTEIEAENVASEVKKVYAQGGFEIRNWLSNSSRVRKNLGVSSNDEQVLHIGPSESQTERVLGMWWAVNQDTFTYSLRFNPTNKEILFNAQRPTKRQALRTLMSIYDPLGFLAPYLVHLKMILQDMWRIGIKWDEQIKEKDDDGLYDRWSNFIKYLPEIEHVRINRHYSNKINSMNPTRIELHVFVDAGDLAYATMAYFRIEDENGVECSLIGGKTKVAPLKPLSTPRMELQAAVLGARFKNSILENHTLNIVRTCIWSDSTTVLSWLRSDLRKYNQFVGLRVGELLETTTLPEWRWIASDLNPADDATKWKNSFSLSPNSRWFKGPDFLTQPEKFWPNSEVNEDTEEELRPKYVHIHTKAEVEKLPIKFEEMMKWKRTMAFVFRFWNNVKARLAKPGFVIRTGLLRRIEFQEGENYLYRKAQRDEFASVLRMSGRIDAVSNISMDQKRPIILPTNHQITELIVNDYHVRYKHRNTETVINEIKQKFIIPRLRALNKRIRRSCQYCKNASVQPAPPKMAQLPAGRLASFTRPFTYVGVDYAGPYKITQYRRSVKRWIVVFTCLTIRGVYIDCVESLTTDSCIMAINRFIARNGTPREFYSDNGINFVGANNELELEIANIDHDQLNTKFTTCYTQWNFNPPHAQHMGGAWERLIGSMKTTLDKILPKSHYPNHETFVTALAEVENIINSRPLTFVSIEPDDQEALTPNHFLKGSSNGNKPPGIFPAPPATLRGNWRYTQQIANEFWKKWVKEYLPMITRRTKWFEDVKPIEVGDQVIIVDENAPRNLWDRGVVIEALQTGTDGRISRASVRTIDGIYTRPVSKLAVLDLKGPEAKTLTRENLAEGSVTASSDKQVALIDPSSYHTKLRSN